MDASSTWIATPNIALIKYWGKRDEKLILPNNSSLSITLGEKSEEGKEFATRTSVLFSNRLKDDVFYLDGIKQDLSNKDTAERHRVLDFLRDMGGVKEKALVVSRNSFPTASGLASSASGISALVCAAAAALDLKLSRKELSVIARQGSGSACRSLFGGFVRWNKGDRADGTDSYAEQTFDENHWPEIVDLVAIVSTEKKKISSRSGMKQTMQTSPLYRARLDYVGGALEKLVDALDRKDFDALASIIIKDSNDMHAVILDTYPPIFYLNDISKEIIYSIDELNATEGKMVAAYTFDAGPNANVITLERYKSKVLGVLGGIDRINDILRLRVGSGPRALDEQDSLIDTETLAPIRP